MEKINKIYFFKPNTIGSNLIDKIKELFISFFWLFGLIIVTITLIVFPLDLFITKVLHFESVKELIHQTQIAYDKYPFYIVVFIGPFVEEVLFRLILIVNKRNLSLFFGVLVYEILRHLFVRVDFQNEFYLYFILIGFIVFAISWFYLPLVIVDFLKGKINLLIPLSIILFGLIHVSNIKILHWQLSLLYPFFVLPQIIMGYFITSLRLKYGFIWGLSLHIIINALSFFL